MASRHFSLPSADRAYPWRFGSFVVRSNASSRGACSFVAWLAIMLIAVLRTPLSGS